MSTLIQTRVAMVPYWGRHAAWFVFVSAVAFLVPFLGVGRPETGNTIISLPMFVTANPLGAIVAHTTMHATAVTHAYETPTFLPPETNVN